MEEYCNQWEDASLDEGSDSMQNPSKASLSKEDSNDASDSLDDLGDRDSQLEASRRPATRGLKGIIKSNPKYLLSIATTKVSPPKISKGNITS